MIQIETCFYVCPRIGDVALMTMQWFDTEAPGTRRHSVVPICGTDAWWHWCRDEPLVVQQAFQQVYADAQATLQARKDTPYDADDDEPGDS